MTKPLSAYKRNLSSFDIESAFALECKALAPVDKKTISDVMREMGRKGGKIGGKRRLETMTPEERKESARKAGKKGAAARWGSRNKSAVKSAEVRSKKAPAKKRAKNRKG